MIIWWPHDEVERIYIKSSFKERPSHEIVILEFTIKVTNIFFLLIFRKYKNDNLVAKEKPLKYLEDLW